MPKGNTTISGYFKLPEMVCVLQVDGVSSIWKVLFSYAFNGVFPDFVECRRYAVEAADLATNATGYFVLCAHKTMLSVQTPKTRSWWDTRREGIVPVEDQYQNIVRVLIVLICFQKALISTYEGMALPT